MSRLLVFNPEHDYALAFRGHNYTPPLSILRLQKDLQHLPLVWGFPDDHILLYDGKTVRIEENFCTTPSQKLDIYESVEPWGWNVSLVEKLNMLSIEGNNIPSKERLESIRNLSHRRTTIKANDEMKSPQMPEEFFDIDKAMTFYKANPDCYFKLPWSGGGRGVVATEELDECKVRQWVSGGIRRQGSVIGEKKVYRRLDFASLWTVGPEKAKFEGFSVSVCDGRGKYDGNLVGHQSELEELILSSARQDVTVVLQLQRNFIESHISPYYSGLMGIDMIVDHDGRVFPCVEINLRRTMGHVALLYSRLSENVRRKLVSSKLPLINFYDFITCKQIR